ncbi:MAG: sensor domain-containing diguanylate cyclase [Myxococcaceae bacterium]|nr:sensor domain-containing diguanylate cyclase [Myxococcaceae bacterium]
MAQTLDLLADVARQLSSLKLPAEVLELVVSRAATLLGTGRVSLRVLDPSGTRLVTTYRAGQPLHWYGDERFQVGQGLVGWVAGHRQPLRSGDAEADPRFEPRPGKKEPMGSFLGVPLFIGERVIGVLSSTDPSKDFFTHEHEGLLTVLAAVCAPYVEVARLSRLAHVDPLTGVLNRRGLDVELALAFQDERRPCVVMVDADRFKSVNDQWGHAAGDDVLRRLAEVLGGVVRADDAVVRLGGEEFLLVLHELELAQAVRVAERAREELAATDIRVPGGSLRVTASFGVARRRPHESRDEVVARADAALLAAKRAGRNRVEVEPDDVVT